MNKIVIGVIVLLLVGIGAYAWTTHSSDTVDTTEDNVKVFVVDSSHLRFYIDGVENPDIVVNEGDRVRIEFTSSEGFHDWVLDEFNAKTERVNPGSSTSVEFVADRKGTFQYYCSVGQHRANGMFGNFIVQ